MRACIMLSLSLITNGGAVMKPFHLPSMPCCANVPQRLLDLRFVFTLNYPKIFFDEFEQYVNLCFCMAFVKTPTCPDFFWSSVQNKVIRLSDPRFVGSHVALWISSAKTHWCAIGFCVTLDRIPYFFEAPSAFTAPREGRGISGFITVNQIG